MERKKVNEGQKMFEVKEKGAVNLNKTTGQEEKKE